MSNLLKAFRRNDRVYIPNPKQRLHTRKKNFNLRTLRLFIKSATDKLRNGAINTWSDDRRCKGRRRYSVYISSDYSATYSGPWSIIKSYTTSISGIQPGLELWTSSELCGSHVFSLILTGLRAEVRKRDSEKLVEDRE